LSTPVIVDITGSDSDGEDSTGRVSEIAVLNSGRHGAFEAQGHLELQGESVDRYKHFQKVVGVVKKSGWFVDGPFATGNGDQHANAMLVISLGKLVTIRNAMQSGGVQMIMAILHGKPVRDKVRLKGMARLKSNNMERLEPYVNFDDGFAGAPSYTNEVEYFAYEEENHGPKHLDDKWSPLEFKCLEYYDWNISPPPHRA